MCVCIQSTKQYRYIAGELGILHGRVQGHEREGEGGGAVFLSGSQ